MLANSKAMQSNDNARYSIGLFTLLGMDAETCSESLFVFASHAGVLPAYS